MLFICAVLSRRVQNTQSGLFCHQEWWWKIAGRKSYLGRRDESVDERDRRRKGAQQVQEEIGNQGEL